MPPEPLVTVIVPAYDMEAFLARAVVSALAQTHRNLEVLIVDDASTDGTAKAAKALCQSDGRVRLLSHEANKGGCAARNTGLREARGEYVAFLDADDEWLPEKLARQLEVFRASTEPGLGLVYSGTLFYAPGAAAPKERPARVRGDASRVILGSAVVGSGSNALVKKAVYDVCGGYDEADELRRGGHQDWEMSIRIAGRYLFDYTAECLVKYHMQATGVTRTSKDVKRARAYEYLTRKHEARYEAHPDVLSSILREAGYYYYHGGERLAAVKAQAGAVRAAPSSPRAWLELGWDAAVPLGAHRALASAARRLGLRRGGG